MRDDELQAEVDKVLVEAARHAMRALGYYRPHQPTLWAFDPCKAYSERSCWQCPLENCRRVAAGL